MSRPLTFAVPPGAAALSLATPRGTFAAIEAPAAPGATRGSALLLPGIMGSKEDFTALLAPLAARGYRTVAVDGRGQYESRGPESDEGPYAQDELARDALAQAAALGPGPVHLVGHSFGGLVARAAALLDHRPLCSLTLMASGPAAVAPSQQERLRLLLDALPVMGMARVWELKQQLEAADSAAGDGAAGIVEHDAEDLRRRWMAGSPAELLAAARQLREEPDRVAQLAAVPLPVHVLSGERDDAWPVPLLDEMARRLGARRTVVAGAEHSPNTDRPKETAEALADFWDLCGHAPAAGD
ncbi:alpha/beta fold hydrolase [Streptomyces sp. NPDC050560]|uniref:alpha/beta fold hydrolase n=1 Tax=Streptomyces sp. NPDC050560 TaxID=3365630 RepID=UPI00378A8650